MGNIGRTARSFNNGATGSTGNIGGGLYLTFLCREGWFADIAGRMDSLHTDFTAAGINNGSFTTNLETLSLEAGRTLKRADGWWLEPSLQAAFAWVNGGAGDTLFDDGAPLHVKADSARDLQYRAMLRFGRVIGGSRWYPYGKIAVAKLDTTGGDVRVNGAPLATPDYAGPRVEFGLGTICRIDEFNQLYFDYTYSDAPDYISPWGLNLGYRVLW
jgi:outer membrane autotransporter protein